MASLAATPSPKKGQYQSPVVRVKSASPWRITRYSPYLPRNPLIPGFSSLGLAAPMPNPIYQASSSAIQQRPEKVIRLTLPFSLRENGVPRGPTEAELPEFQKLFPTLRTIGYSHPFLVVCVGKLPEKPWPTFVADLPVWLTTSTDDPPLELGKFARANQTFNVKGEIEYYKTPKEATIFEIFDLVNGKGAGINRIQFDGCIFRAFGSQEPGQGWENRLPSRINGFSISYIWTKSNIQEHALRMRLPDANVTDDTYYGPQYLRPGIMLGGLPNNMQQSLGTTSGVCVRSPKTGKTFITVAAHGFPASVGGAVYHPRAYTFNGKPDDRYQIATIDRKFGDTDIALAELKPGISYSGKTFDHPESGYQPAKSFRSLKNPEHTNPGDTVFMNTPVNGQCEGVHVRTQWACAFEATDEAPQELKKHCEISNFSYFGNGSDIFFEGCCGGVIWDKDLDVLAQFRFQQKDGQMLAYSPTFKVLIDQGYQLSTM
jgi:hypothetical protein